MYSLSATPDHDETLGAKPRERRRVNLLRRWPCVALPVLVLALSAACGAERASERPPDSPAEGTPSPGAAGTTGTPAPTNTEDEESAVQIRITVGEHTFSADLQESAASRDLLAQLPTILQMRDHGGVEKTGRLPDPLSLDGQPSGADPDVGDVGYYAPGNDLVLYYGDQSYYNGIVVLGRMEDGAPARLATLPGTVTVTVSAVSQ